MASREDIQKEVTQNYEFFLKERDKIPVIFFNKYVLLKNSEIIEYFDSIDDAIKYAKKVFDDELYSIQKVNETPTNLGFIGVFINA